MDIIRDIRTLNELARKSKKAGMIVLGGGVCKHQIANAMLIVSHINFSIEMLSALTFFLAQWCGLFSVYCAW